MLSNISKVKVSLGVAALFAMTGPALADWSQSAISFGHTSAGASGQVDCPAGGTPGSIWGTGTYTSDSSICGAAQHYGWIPPGGGGTVSYVTVPGLPSYQGSVQNGIATSDYGSWDLAFHVTGVTGGGGASAQTIPWNTNADALGIASDVGQVHSYVCPAYDGVTTLTAWGTGYYSSDSSICAAALHAGLLNAQVGGPVRVQVLGQQANFTGTQANGVNSSSYGAWPRSYTFAQ